MNQELDYSILMVFHYSPHVISEEKEEHNHFHLLSDIVLTDVIVIHLQAVHTVLAHHKCCVKTIGTK